MPTNPPIETVEGGRRVHRRIRRPKPRKLAGTFRRISVNAPIETDEIARRKPTHSSVHYDKLACEPSDEIRRIFRPRTAYSPDQFTDGYRRARQRISTKSATNSDEPARRAHRRKPKNSLDEFTYEFAGECLRIRRSKRSKAADQSTGEFAGFRR